MIINHNIAALFANRHFSVSNAKTEQTMARLSSGVRINRAAEDAAGLSISEKMRTQIRGLNRALMNTMDGISFIQTTEGYLGEISSSIQRIRELAIQCSNGILSDEDRGYVQVEIDQLLDNIDFVGNNAQFNGLKMLSGMFKKSNAEERALAEMYLHMGANMDERVQVFIGEMNTTALGLRSGESSLNVAKQDKANFAIGLSDAALQKINELRADLGAYQNRLESASRSLMIGSENLQSSESRIRDANIAKESSKMATNSVLSQAATAMLAQANQQPQMILQLLR